jgi:hypothetical protein
LKKILIISPHFPPSNLAAVHRSRLFAQHLPEFGWEPVILTVHERYYEEAPDRDLEKLLPQDLRIEKVSAFNLTSPRIIGDIGLRAFIQLYRMARTMIQNEEYDFLLIPIPSFYPALLGRMLHRSTGIRYGIDYIDPWVHRFPGSEKIFSRHWWSTRLARILEPLAVKKASLITGVAEGYYKPVLERNPDLKKYAVYGAMPYGGEESDHKKINESSLSPYLFQKQEGVIDLVYAGALLPKAYAPMESIFRVISEKINDFKGTRFHFIGTGKTPNDDEGFNVKPLALKYGLWDKFIFEYPKRIPYLDVLIHLKAADGIFILGSTEPHYTPSKVYQSVISGKPILAVLNRQASAVDVLRSSGAGRVICIESEDVQAIEKEFLTQFREYKKDIKTWDAAKVNPAALEKYSARSVTKQLAALLDKAVS